MTLKFCRTISLLGFRPWGDLGGLTSYTTKTGRIVWFPKSPPQRAPSPAQQAIRNMFRQVAAAWQGLTPAQRDDWKKAIKYSRTSLDPYHNFVYFYRKRNLGRLRTLERQSGVKLFIPPASVPP